VENSFSNKLLNEFKYVSEIIFNVWIVDRYNFWHKTKCFYLYSFRTLDWNVSSYLYYYVFFFLKQLYWFSHSMILLLVLISKTCKPILVHKIVPPLYYRSFDRWIDWNASCLWHHCKNRFLIRYLQLKIKRTILFHVNDTGF